MTNKKEYGEQISDDVVEINADDEYEKGMKESIENVQDHHSEQEKNDTERRNNQSGEISVIGKEDNQSESNNYVSERKKDNTFENGKNAEQDNQSESKNYLECQEFGKNDNTIESNSYNSVRKKDNNSFGTNRDNYSENGNDSEEDSRKNNSYSQRSKEDNQSEREGNNNQSRKKQDNSLRRDNQSDVTIALTHSNNGSDNVSGRHESQRTDRGSKELVRNERRHHELAVRNVITSDGSESAIVALLHQVEDDVQSANESFEQKVYVIDDHLGSGDGGRSSLSAAAQNNPTTIQHKTFVQNKRGFTQTGTSQHQSHAPSSSRQSTSRVRIFDQQENIADAREQRKTGVCLNTPLDIAILIQTCFRSISNICHGLLGGVALFELMLMFFIEGNSFTRPSSSISSINSIFKKSDFSLFREDPNESALLFGKSNEVYLTKLSYASFAFLPPALFLFLLVICVVSAFDRFDVSSNFSVSQLVHLMQLRKSFLVVPIYLVALLFSLVCYKYDEMFVYLAENPNDIAFAKNLKGNDMTVWKVLNFGRCVLSLLAWVLIVLGDPGDSLQHHLKSIQTYELAMVAKK